MKKIKKWWSKLKYWKRGLYISLLLYLILNFAYLTWSILNLGEITCPTFEGSICGDIKILGYLIISLVWFFWYFIFIGLPMIFIFIIIGYFKSKNEK